MSAPLESVCQRAGSDARGDPGQQEARSRVEDSNGVRVGVDSLTDQVGLDLDGGRVPDRTNVDAGSAGPVVAILIAQHDVATGVTGSDDASSSTGLG